MKMITFNTLPAAKNDEFKFNGPNDNSQMELATHIPPETIPSDAKIMFETQQLPSQQHDRDATSTLLEAV